MKRNPKRGAAMPQPPGNISRRAFMAGGTTAMTAIAAGLTGCTAADLERFLRGSFRELGQDEIARILADMQRDYTERLGRKVSLTATPARPGTLYGYALDLSRCVGDLDQPIGPGQA